MFHLFRQYRPFTKSLKRCSKACCTTSVFVLGVFSSGLSAADQHVSLNAARTESYVGSEDRTRKMKPDIYTLGYSISFDNNLALNASLWVGDDNLNFTDNDFQLEQEQSGFSLGTSFFFERYGVYLSASRSETTLTLRSPTQLSSADQEDEYRDVLLSADVSYNFNYVDVRPEFGVGFQKTSREQRISITSGALQSLETREEDSDGSYFLAGLSFSGWHEISSDLIWQPVLSVAWNDPIDGEISASGQRSVRFGRSNPRQSSSAENETGSSKGSGYYDLGLYFYLRDMSVSLNYSKTFEQAPNSESMGLGIGVSF